MGARAALSMGGIRGWESWPGWRGDGWHARRALGYADGTRRCLLGGDATMARRPPELDAFRKGVYDEYHRTTVGALTAQLKDLDPDTPVVFSLSPQDGGAAPVAFHAVVEHPSGAVHIQLDEIGREQFNVALQDPAFRAHVEARKADAAPAQTVDPGDTFFRRLSKLTKG
jgi:hypothetical protein